MYLAIAPPISAPQQNIIASFSVAGPGHRLNKEDIPALIDQVKNAASRISIKLGG
ncbi:IclR family transcriptional regulator C-terminal domain-containing protein [Paenibacillus glucanolyticus]